MYLSFILLPVNTVCATKEAMKRMEANWPVRRNWFDRSEGVEHNTHQCAYIQIFDYTNFVSIYIQYHSHRHAYNIILRMSSKVPSELHLLCACLLGFSLTKCVRAWDNETNTNMCTKMVYIISMKTQLLISRCFTPLYSPPSLSLYCGCVRFHSLAPKRVSFWIALEFPRTSVAFPSFVASVHPFRVLY
jgi:hypothetical protein